MSDTVAHRVLYAEGVLLAVGIATLVAIALWRWVRTAWLRPRLDRARGVVTLTLAGQESASTLPWLPRRELVRLLAEAARTVDMSARDRLAVLPACERLVNRAERWCRSRRWPLRLRGARLLTILGGGEDVVPRLLRDPRPEVRSQAAAWVAPHPTRGRLTRLVRMLDDDALACRLVARATLVRLGRLATEPVAEHLSGASPTALADALTVSAHLADPALLGPALRHVHHHDPEVRAAVARVLSAVGGPQAIAGLEALLGDLDPNVRAEATSGLGLLGHWPSAAALAQRLRDPAWAVRLAAGMALRGFNAPGRLYLQRALRGDDRFAADMAAHVLGLPDEIRPLSRVG